MNGLKARGEKPAPSTTRVIGLLAFTTFVVLTSEFVVVGLLPVMAKDLLLSFAEAGWFVTCFALSAAIFGPLLTILATNYDPRKVLISVALAFALGNLLIAFMPLYSVVMAVRVLQGCLLPVIASVAVVLAARLVEPAYVGGAVSRVNVGVVGATVLGIPACVVIADAIGWQYSFASLAVLGFASAALIARWCPRLGKSPRSSMSAEVSLLLRPEIHFHLALSCCLFMGMFAGYTYISPLLAHVAELDGSAVGWALLGFGLAGVLGNWVAGLVVSRDPLMATTWVALALSLAMSAIGPAGGSSQIVLASIVGLWGMAHMAAFVVCQVRVMKAGQESAALAVSLNISACNIGIGLGSTFGGYIVDQWGVAAIGYAGAIPVAFALAISIWMVAGRIFCGQVSRAEQ